MSTLSAPSKRSDAVSDADRVDAAHIAERVVVKLRRTTQITDGPRSRVTEREQSGEQWILDPKISWWSE